MVHWQTVTKSMSLAKSLQTSSTVLTKKGCHQSHYSSPSRINKHHYSSPHRSQVTSSKTSSTSTPKHLFNAKPKDSIFDEDDVNQICLSLKNQKLSLSHNNHNNHSQSRMTTTTTTRRTSRVSMDQNRNNSPCEYKEDEINDAFSKRMPNKINEILSRSKSMHELGPSWSSHHSIHNIHNISDKNKNKKEIKKKIEIDNNLNISNILPGGISMQNIDKFEHDDDEYCQSQKYPQDNIVHNHQQQNQDGNGSMSIKINIKHSPWDDNLTWNAINITL